MYQFIVMHDIWSHVSNDKRTAFYIVEHKVGQIELEIVRHNLRLSKWTSFFLHKKLYTIERNEEVLLIFSLGFTLLLFLFFIFICSSVFPHSVQNGSAFTYLAITIKIVKRTETTTSACYLQLQLLAHGIKPKNFLLLSWCAYAACVCVCMCVWIKWIYNLFHLFWMLYLIIFHLSR